MWQRQIIATKPTFQIAQRDQAKAGNNLHEKSTKWSNLCQ
jgi:hypothetical protein